MSRDRIQQHLGVYTTEGFKSGMTEDDARKAKLIVLRGAVQYRKHCYRMRKVRENLGLK